ncbi:MAG: filamentous hemagglutinin N-terminal domain-containing protein [Nostoc indistinguendum CM1-VF10]|nr:filamentous hemagglutinin N-terminal domain-containing protein [Nostoc indistinguendum CM1-VF10]
MNQTHHPVKDSIKSIFLYLISTVFSFALPAQGQITPDNSLGQEASRLNQNQIINGAPGDEINGGATRGSNLFHSFSEFNINEGQRVYFANSTGVENILTRVTGGNASNIFGTLGVAGAANLFLMNPAGIVFGQNAQLDVQGSFVGTTANGVQFDNQQLFSATNPQTPSLLTVGVPVGLQYGGNPGAIQVQGASLKVPNGQSLTLASGAVNIDGGKLFAPGGRVELGGVSAAGTIGLNGDGSLSFPDNVARANVSLLNRTSLDTSADNGGSIAIHAQNIDILQESRLSAGIASGLGDVNSQAGDITLSATGAIRVEQRSRIENSVNRNATGNTGNITLLAEGHIILNSEASMFSRSSLGGNINLKSNAEISLTDSSIQSSNFVTIPTTTDKAGNINVNATDSIKFTNSFISTVLISGEKGKAGEINLNTTRSLFLKDGSQLSSISIVDGQGDAGSVNINARDLVSFDGVSNDGFFNSGIHAFVPNGSVGNGGDVNITTGSLSLTNGGRINLSTFGKGNGGNVTITARNTVSLDSLDVKNGRLSAIITAARKTDERVEGKGGDINITARSFSLTNGGQLDASTSSKVNAGNINIQATDNVSLNGVNSIGYSSAIFSDVFLGSEGKGGDINITTGSLSLKNGAQLLTSTAGQGNAGNVNINARNTVSLDGLGKNVILSAIFSDVSGSEAIGNGGNINITTGSLLMTNDASLNSSTSGKGNAGSVNINANTVSFDKRSIVRSAVEAKVAEGNAGDISITTNSLQVNNGAQVSVNTLSSGKAGNINLKVNDNITLTGSGTGIFANTTEGSTGNGGNIIIDPRTVIIRDGATISAASEGEGIGGDIELTAGSLTLDQGTISTETRSNTGGNITLNLQDLLLLRNSSKISTNAGTASASGNGGNINIDGKFIVAIPNEDSDISANAFSGTGGNIQINSQGIFGIESRPEPTQKSDITASSELGVSGVININTPDNSSIQNSFTQLSPNVIDTNALIANSCIARGTKRQENSFTITGSGALRNSPGDVLMSAYTTGDVRNVEPTSRPWKKGDPIIEAQGLYRLADGQLMLSRECG